MSDELTFEERRALDAWLPMPAPAGFAERVLDARASEPPPSRARRRAVVATIGVVVAAAAVAVVVLTRLKPEPAPDAPTTTVGYAPPAPVIDAGLPAIVDARRALPPTTADLRVPAGDGGTIHDPRGRVSLEIDFAGSCANGGFVEVSPGAKLAPLPPVRGRDSAILELDTGRWSYAVYCETTPSSPPLAEGEFLVVRDAGNRPLPVAPATNAIDADGRVYRISYQRATPSLRVRGQRRNDGNYRLRVTAGADEQTYDARGPMFDVPAFALRDGTYQLRTDEAPDAQVTTVIIERDWTLPQVVLRSPRVDEVWRGELVVEGTALPGWIASVDGVDLPRQPDGSFEGRLMIRPGAKVLAVRFVHYARGVHYYLRRPRP